MAQGNPTVSPAGAPAHIFGGACARREYGGPEWWGWNRRTESRGTGLRLVAHGSWGRSGLLHVALRMEARLQALGGGIGGPPALDVGLDASSGTLGSQDFVEDVVLNASADRAVEGRRWRGLGEACEAVHHCPVIPRLQVGVLGSSQKVQRAPPRDRRPEALADRGVLVEGQMLGHLQSPYGHLSCNVRNI
eukprot:scaffold739_cov166-Pinguiococcus_pyrenoidosus.AAC.6